LTKLHTQETDHQAELGDLRQPHRSHHGIAPVKPGEIKQRKEAWQKANQQEIKRQEETTGLNRINKK
jgi:hypothetical protein